MLGHQAVCVGDPLQAADNGDTAGRAECAEVHCLPQCWVLVHMDLCPLPGQWNHLQPYGAACEKPHF